MKIKSLRFNGIRNFVGEVTFDFTDTNPLTTISGKNGSGKTTIFKSLVLCQKAFFINQLNNAEKHQYVENLSLELKKYFLRKDSFIEIGFSFDTELTFNYSFKIICSEYSPQKIKWGILCTEDSKTKIESFWNFANPSEIIVFVDSDKHFFETNISHENISVKTKTNNQFLIDTILNPEKLFSNIYQSLVNDYLKERIVC